MCKNIDGCSELELMRCSTPICSGFARSRFIRNDDSVTRGYISRHRTTNEVPRETDYMNVNCVILDHNRVQ